MPISRGQMPRQLYGLGSLVKSLTKGVKGAVKSVGKIAKSPLGLAAIASFVPFGGKSLFTRGMDFIGGGGLSGIADFFSGDKTFGKTIGILGGGTLLGGVLNSLSPEEKEEVSSGRNIEALRTKLTEAYKNQRTFSDSENEDAAIAAQVQSDLSEYTKDMSRGYAEGGRIGFNEGSYNPGARYRFLIDKFNSGEKLTDDEVRELEALEMSYADRSKEAYGGRIGYARGDTAEQNAMQASGIMGLPLNENPAGVTELDLRESGGFIPPVGVKEKADDIPAMLSNNEFVFTADAVRGMGDGNVNLGAQRMYDMMKKLENGGRV